MNKLLLEEKWWEKYPCMNTEKFSYENSGRAQMETCPYIISSDGIEPFKPFDKGWVPTGYMLNPPFNTFSQRTVGIMFEKENGEQTWFHFPINDEEWYREK